MYLILGMQSDFEHYRDSKDGQFQVQGQTMRQLYTLVIGSSEIHGSSSICMHWPYTMDHRFPSFRISVVLEIAFHAQKRYATSMSQMECGSLELDHPRLKTIGTIKVFV